MSGFQRDSHHVLFNLDEFRYSFKGLKILFLAFVVIHLIAALVAPAVYKMILWWNVHFPNQLNAYLIGKPFPEYFDRARYFFLLLSIPWIIFQVRLLSSRKLGYAGDRPWFAYFGSFYMFGLISAVIVLGILISVDAVAIEGSLGFGTLLWGLITAFVAAFFIASLKELIFRSVFFRMFYTALTPMVSVVLSSMFFAYLHFKQPHSLWDYEMPPSDVTWLDGFVAGFYILFGIVVSFNLVLFLNLTLVGYCLTVVFMKTRSLWAAVGLHAGWVTPISLFMEIAVRDVDKQSLWWGTYRLSDGIFTTVFLLLLAVYFTKIYRPKQPTGFTL